MKNFRLLLVMSSLLALVCSFTACSTDIADNYPTITVELTAGEATASSVSFTINANGADDLYYWVTATPAEGVEDDPQLLIEKGTYLDASVDTPFEQVVTATGLKALTEYNVYVYAKNLAHKAFATPVKITTAEAVNVATPSVAVVLDAAEVTENSFLAFVTTTNAQKAAWLVLPKYTTGVTAAKVFAEGTAIKGALNADEIVVEVTGLEAKTDYDFYVAVDNQGVQVLSEVATASTLAPASPVIELNFDELMSATNLVNAIGLPGVWVTLRDSATGAMASLFMYDFLDYPNYAGYLSAGDYPALTGSVEDGVYPETSCLLADPAFTNFQDANGTYYPVGNLGTDNQGAVYGVNIMTTMPAQDQNQLTFNVPVTDDSGKLLVIKGQYTGSLGYVANLAALQMDLKEWGFTSFESSVEGNVVTLKCANLNGDFIIVLNTENGKWLDTAFVAGEGGNMTGGYTSFLEGAPETFEFTSGRILISKVDDNGNYTLNVSTHGGDWVMRGQSGAYKIVAPEEGYAITVKSAASENQTELSVDGKRWALPASFSQVVAGSAEAVCFVDMGVTTAGKLVIACDLESVYGAQAAGFAQAMMSYDYLVTPTDATSGTVSIVALDHYGDATVVDLPYTNLTAESVTVDFTNMLGSAGITVCECSLFTKNVTIQ